MTDRIILKGSTSLLKPIITQILAIHQLLESKDVGNIYGIPTSFYQQEALTYVPQVTLHFIEDIDDVEPGYDRIYGEINYRLIGETHETITEAKLKILGNKIKTTFGGATAFLWRKGKIRCSYADKDKGYFLQILSRDISSGKNVIEQVLSLQNHRPEWKRLNTSENQESLQAYPTIPPTETILGERKRLPRRRPIADVRFTKAECHIYGLPAPKILYDRTKKSRVALVS